jgi:hypothetical protein
MQPTPDCCICGKQVEEKTDPETGRMFWNQGNDPSPVRNEGRCCDTCNETIVLTTRLFFHQFGTA